MEKPKCPECDTEIVLIDSKLPKSCAKCGFPLSVYEPLKRILKAYDKEKSGNTTPPPEPEKKEKKSFFEGLADLLE